MQNRYAGDVGDFGKLGMLRHITKSGLKMGVNWYLVPNEFHNYDGKHINYLNNSDFYHCDDCLLNSLREIVTSGHRTIKALENANLIPKALYYNKILYSHRTVNATSRNDWHKAALKALAVTDIVFLDPDNGLLVKSIGQGSQKSNKYVFKEEIIDYYQAGHSVVFYNHRSRITEEKYLERFRRLKEEPGLKGAEWFGLKFKRGTIRDYFFILQPHHAEKVKNAMQELMQSNFKRHFSPLNIETIDLNFRLDYKLDKSVRIKPHSKSVKLHDLRQISLYHYNDGIDERHINAYIENGQLRIDGQDLGELVRRLFDDADYEYFYIMSVDETKKLHHLLKDRFSSDEDLLSLLEKHFPGADCCKKFEEFCKTNQLKYDFSVYI